MNEIVIFGAGGFAREVHQLIEDLNVHDNRWSFLGFLDGNAASVGRSVHGYPILGDASWLQDRPDVAVVVAVGNTAAKRRIVASIDELRHRRFATLVHPLAWVGKRVDIGEGAILCAGARVTTDITIGKHAILNLDVTVGHDAQIGDYATIAPSANISGTVALGEGVDIGTNCTIIQGVRVGAWSVLGAGAVVLDDIPDNVTAVGVPAKPIKQRTPGWHLA